MSSPPVRYKNHPLPNALAQSEYGPTSPFQAWRGILGPVILLCFAYGLLALTLTERLTHTEIMKRCVLVDPKLSRIWSVGNVEIGVAYFGVFGGMVAYFLGVYKRSATQLKDLGYAVAYLAGSFALDALCVRLFSPFVAMLIGDAIVMTFTLSVSKLVWFQRLLGVFIPLIFLTCGLGHFLEGISYWCLTYPVNVPWTMVTADIGFAVLVNASRFPAFIRGEDVLTELSEEQKRNDVLQHQIAARQLAELENIRLVEELQASGKRQRQFFKDVMSSVTEGRLQLCSDYYELPTALSDSPLNHVTLTSDTLSAFRAAVRKAGSIAQFPEDRLADMLLAAGEAAMNAVVHAVCGEATIYADPEKRAVQVWIADRGKGIDMEWLPQATLVRGATTAGSMGHGFWMMLKTADQISMLTGPGGTTIVLQQNAEPHDEDFWIRTT